MKTLPNAIRSAAAISLAAMFVVAPMGWFLFILARGIYNAGLAQCVYTILRGVLGLVIVSVEMGIMAGTIGVFSVAMERLYGEGKQPIVAGLAGVLMLFVLVLELGFFGSRF